MVEFGAESWGEALEALSCRNHSSRAGFGVSVSMLHSRQALHEDGLVQDAKAWNAAADPWCMTQPGQAQLGPQLHMTLAIEGGRTLGCWIEDNQSDMKDGMSSRGDG